MINSTALILCGIALVIAIFISVKTKANLGIICMVCAWLIGCFVLKLSPSKVIAFWPTSIVFRLMIVTAFFGYGIQNGTFKWFTKWILYQCRNFTWAMPIAVFLVTFLISVSGAGANGITPFMAAIGAMLAMESGIAPILYIIGVTSGGLLGAGIYYSGGGAVMKGLYEAIPEYADASLQMTMDGFVNQALVHIVAFAILYVLCKGWKSGKVTIEKPEPIDDKQKKTLLLILVCLICVFVPIALKLITKAKWASTLANYMDVQFICCTLAVVAGLMKLAKERDVILKSIPWNTIVMLGGVTLLLGVANSAGLTDLVKTWTENVSAALVVPIIVLVAGILSCFSGAVTVVAPLLVPMVPAMVAATGCNPTILGSYILIGANCTACSPLSTGGAMANAAIPDEAARNKAFGQQVLVAIAINVIAMIFGFFGIGLTAPF